MDSILSLLHSLSGPCSHPGSKNSASWCALFLTPLQTSCSGQRNPQEEGKEAESMVMARLEVEWGVLGLEKSNVSQISRSYGSQVL